MKNATTGMIGFRSNHVMFINLASTLAYCSGSQPLAILRRISTDLVTGKSPKQITRAGESSKTNLTHYVILKNVCISKGILGISFNAAFLIFDVYYLVLSDFMQGEVLLNNTNI